MLLVKASKIKRIRIKKLTCPELNLKSTHECRNIQEITKNIIAKLVRLVVNFKFQPGFTNLETRNKNKNTCSVGNLISRAVF